MSLTTALIAIQTADHWIRVAGEERGGHYIELRGMLEDVRREVESEILKEVDE